MQSTRQFWNATSRATCLAAACLTAVFLDPCELLADEPDAALRVQQVVKAAGGEDKLLKVFRFNERVLITSTVTPLKPEDKSNRTSTIEIGNRMWVGNAPREKDKVRVLCWAWSLRILLDPKSKFANLDEIRVGDRPAFGLRVTEEVKEPIDLYFDKETLRLVAIDYTDTRHVFSEWKKTDAGHSYPSHVSGFRFADKSAKTLAEKQWYQTDILELAPLAEVPAELAK